MLAERHVLVPGVLDHVSEEDPEPSKGSIWKRRNRTVPAHFKPRNAHTQNDTPPSACEMGIQGNRRCAPFVDSQLRLTPFAGCKKGTVPGRGGGPGSAGVTSDPAEGGELPGEPPAAPSGRSSQNSLSVPPVPRAPPRPALNLNAQRWPEQRRPRPEPCTCACAVAARAGNSGRRAS